MSKFTLPQLVCMTILTSAFGLFAAQTSLQAQGDSKPRSLLPASQANDSAHNGIVTVEAEIQPVAGSSPQAQGAQKPQPHLPSSEAHDDAHNAIVSVEAEIQPADPFQSSGDPKGVKWAPGQRLELFVKVTPALGWHGYPFSLRAANQEVAYLSKLKWEPADAVLMGGPVTETEPSSHLETTENIQLLQHDGPFWVRVPFLLSPKTPAGKVSLKVHIKLQVCDTQCIWGDHSFVFDAEVAGAPQATPQPIPPVWQMPITVKEDPAGTPTAQPAGPRTAEKSAEKPSGAKPLDRAPVLPEDGAFEIVGLYEEGKINKADDFVAFLTSPKVADTTPKGFWSFLLQGVFWGAISLVTPCVFPMIPVTVSFFLKQTNNRYSPFVLAAVYCGTIITVLSLAAFAFLSVFVWLSTNTWFNAAMGFLFIYFSLSLLGMYDIELPSFLTRFTSSRESQGGIAGTIFMALTFTMLSFACVAPFLGGFGGVAVQEGMPWWERLLGGVAFSATFASPFFLLALFPGYLKNLPKSGGWLNTVKVTMGFLELAAAIKFFRLAEIKAGDASLFTYDFSMALTVGILLACSAYLFGWFRLPLDTPGESLSVPRVAIAVLIFALGIHLLPAIWAQPQADGGLTRVRPQGVVFSWLDAFLLPDEAPAVPGDRQAHFSADLDWAVEQSKKDGKLIFVDFTGVTCTNCKWNESNVFTLPKVKQLFERYRLVQLYTDRVPGRHFPEGALAKEPGLDTATADLNRAFQSRVFQTAQLPLYAILKVK